MHAEIAFSDMKVQQAAIAALVANGCQVDRQRDWHPDGSFCLDVYIDTELTETAVEAWLQTVIKPFDGELEEVITYMDPADHEKIVQLGKIINSLVITQPTSEIITTTLLMISDVIADASKSEADVDGYLKRARRYLTNTAKSRFKQKERQQRHSGSRR